MRFLFLTLGLWTICASSYAQREPDKIYHANIGSVQLFPTGNQYNYPIITLGSVGGLELHFDDLDNYVKNYNYTYQLCNADWTPVNLSTFDYIQGFTQNRLTQFRNSSIATTRYIHYQVNLPERNCMPSKSGNYLLKVYLNGDTSQLAFTRRILIAESGVTIAAAIQQPFDATKARTHHKLQFTVDKTQLNVLNPAQQLQVVALQNFRWDNAVTGKQPMFMRGNLFEYNGERDFLFPAGKEYRWADLGSFRFLSERMDRYDLKQLPFEIWLKPDGEWTQSRYLYYADLNGFSETRTTDNINPWWQGDYAYINFIYVPAARKPIPNKELYIGGQFSQYKYTDQYRMIFNDQIGAYEKRLLLKQGYYTYAYFTPVSASPQMAIPNTQATGNTPQLPGETTFTDGNYWETEDDYTILVYYRAFSDRYDRLVGLATINSRASRIKE
ncbi:type IX secretion system plug protein [Filimonas effusa]|uniref:DUF5103 domain-containing protein n=1 Tax=Filimonas effusa TaxID=2508721 RepID=A0A4Q1DAG0_9BACT|nr:DUF5103 domain-containing protein [Filimonas effusa]RXK85469.1 DUF5103 domain-containing protein [Filimonas effusa]